MAVTLTPLSATLLGLELLDLREADPTCERWTIARPRRVKIGRSRKTISHTATLLGLIDGAPGPVECAIDGERWTKGMKPILDVWSERPVTIGGFPIMRQASPRRRKVGKKKRRRQKVAV
jgi:hypothetical protein